MLYHKLNFDIVALRLISIVLKIQVFIHKCACSKMDGCCVVFLGSTEREVDHQEKLFPAEIFLVKTRQLSYE